MKDHLKETIIEKLASIITFVCENPLVFVSETDVHALVMSELMQIEGLKYTDLIDTACSIGLNKYGKPSEKKYKTMKIHKEYGHCDQDYARSDIVIMNENEISKIRDPLNLKTDDSKSSYIVPDYLIEFGTEKAAGSSKVFQEHLKSDIEKAKKSKEVGFIIHIHRNRVGKKGLEENRNKFGGYLKVLKKISQAGLPNNLRLLVLIIEIGNDKRNIQGEGKVKIFKNGIFSRVNAKKIKGQIKEILERNKQGEFAEEQTKCPTSRSSGN